MTQPQSRAEYLERFTKSQSIEGYGFETAQIMPCPFCAAPRWMVAKIVEFEATASKDHHCGECGRSAKFIFTRAELPSGRGTEISIGFELVQTAGSEPPEWLEPKPRRIDEAES